MKTLTKIKARLEAATPGPWGITKFPLEAPRVFQVYSESTQNPEFSGEWICEVGEEKDLALIAHAPTDIARLLAALEKCMEQRDREMEDPFGAINTSNFKMYNAELERILSGEGE